MRRVLPESDIDFIPGGRNPTAGTFREVGGLCTEPVKSNTAGRVAVSGKSQAEMRRMTPCRA
jgi:hypothetical protein